MTPEDKAFNKVGFLIGFYQRKYCRACCGEASSHYAEMLSSLDDIMHELKCTGSREDCTSHRSYEEAVEMDNKQFETP